MSELINDAALIEQYSWTGIAVTTGSTYRTGRYCCILPQASFQRMNRCSSSVSSEISWQHLARLPLGESPSEHQPESGRMHTLRRSGPKLPTASLVCVSSRSFGALLQHIRHHHLVNRTGQVVQHETLPASCKGSLPELHALLFTSLKF